jgi:hypothetical protein
LIQDLSINVHLKLNKEKLTLLFDELQ